MGNSAAILIDNKHYRKSRVKHFTFALGSDLLHRLEYFLKGNDRDHRRDHVVIPVAAHYWNRNGERHLLARTNNLRAANYSPSATHPRQYIADSLVNFLSFDNVWLKGPAQL